MKSRIILFLAITSLITLSFTFISVGSSKIEKSTPNAQVHPVEPIGGFALEDKL